MLNRRPRLLLLHGVLSGRATWGRLQRELAEDAATLAPDLLGNGRSFRPAEAYDLDAIVEHLLPIVERFQPTHVVGHSMGAIVALALRSRCPDRFEGVGLIGVPVFVDRGDALAYLGQRGRVVRGILADHRRAHLICLLATRAGPGWAALLSRRYPALPVEVLRATFDHNRAAHGGALDGIVFAGRVPQLAASDGARVTVLHGERDRAAPLDAARRLAEAMGWGFTAVADATHQAVIEQPEVVAEWVREEVFSSGKGRVESGKRARADPGG